MLVSNMPIISSGLWKNITNSLVIGCEHNTMALQTPSPLFVNAKIRGKSIKTIPTHCQKTLIYTVPVHPNSVWSQKTIRNAGIKSTPFRQQGQTIHPTGMRQIHIPWQSSGQHPSFSQSAPSHPNHPNLPKIQCSKPSNSSIILPHRKTPYYCITQAIWY